MADKPFMVVPAALTQIASGNERPGRAASNLGEFAYRGMVWRSNGSGSLWVRGSFGTAQLIGFVAMLGASAQPGTTIRIRLGASAAAVDGSGATYDSGALPFISPAITRTDAIYHSHHRLPTPVTATWWRVDIAGHSSDFEASMLAMGAVLEAARYYETDWRTGIRDLGSITFGRNGVPAVALGQKLRSLEYKLGWASEAEMETMLAPLDERVGRTTPFLTCFDPAPTPYRQRRTFFGWQEEVPVVGKVAFNRFERGFQILSLW